MTKFIESRKAKFIAVFMAFNMLLEMIAPVIAFGLTGGPSQPEVDSFEPVGTTQMVDLFSGDFNYNIPLFDLGGYPINIAYHGGIGMEQEASWVGLGWNINPGAITRSMRGIPDDFNGDEIQKRYKVQNNVTLGADVTTVFEIFGFDKKKKEMDQDALDTDTSVTKTLNKGLLSLSLGVYHNSYKGYGINFNIGLEMSKEQTTSSTNYYKSPDDGKDVQVLNTEKVKKISGGFKLGFDSQNGVDISASLSKPKKNKYMDGEFGLNFSHNSIGGLKSLQFGVSNLNKLRSKESNQNKSSKRIGNFGVPIPISKSTYIPSASANTTNYSYAVDFAIGSETWGAFKSGRINAYYNKTETKLNESYKSYGFLHESAAGDNSLTDFNREKDGAYTQEMSHLPLSFSTYDIYNVAGQGTWGMYRPHRNNLGNKKEPEFTSKTGGGVGLNLSLDLGLGQVTKFGAKLGINNNSGKFTSWNSKDNNEAAKLFNYNKNTDNKLFEEVYFKGGGELTPSDENFYQQFGWDQPVKFKLEINSLFAPKAGNFAKLHDSVVRKDGGVTKPLALKANGRQIRSNVMTYLTAKEASTDGISLESTIKSYPLNSSWITGNSEMAYSQSSHPSFFNRVTTSRKEHHISEIKHFSPDGTQYVYGIPAYNNLQRERTFSVKRADINDVNTGLISFSETDDSPSNDQGIQKMYSSTEIPPFAHSYLLTGVLSPDYIDLTGDGITDDDLGTAVKFNYTKYTNSYKWRTPYSHARLSEGLKSDNYDQVGSYVYGEKELWYVHSIVSKTHIAEFKLSPRNDGIGTNGTLGGKDNDAISNKNCQLKLDSIVIYSKFDRVKNGDKAVPVKTIVFVYDYSLCKGIPNSINAGELEEYEESGKLTLKEIYFTYGKSGKGKLSPYKFTYSNTNPDYDLTKVDRWGNYAESDGKSLMVDFPFVRQDESGVTNMDSFSSAWCLNKVQLPSGGLIKIEYESDDYAYVQDKKAMQMFKIVACGNSKNIDPTTQYKNTLYDGSTENEYLFFKLNKPITGGNAKEIIKQQYLTDENGKMLKELYFNFHTNLSMNTGGTVSGENYEYVSGYVEIDPEEYGVSIHSGYGYIKVTKISQGDAGITKINPITKMIWQDALLDKRHLVFKGSTTTGDGASAIRGLLGTFPQLLNIITGPYQYLRWNKVGKYFKLDDSWVRLYNPYEMKKGGGARVKQILINDNWANMDSEQKSTEYGQKFEYKQLDNSYNKTESSSGVASYEPLVGAEENPFREPVRYDENVRMGPDKLLFQNKPFGETVLPPASVGYSSVIVTNIAKNKTQGTATGYTVNEFYTSKDYPVFIENTDLTYKDNSKGKVGDILTGLFSYFKADYSAVSQGYVIKMNDMHGKPKSVKVYGEMNNGTDLISGTEYLYKELERGKLANTVKVLTTTGAVKERMLGVEMDISLDNRHSFSRSINGGISFDIDGVFPILFIPVPFIGVSYSQMNTGFYSSVITKVIQQYGILEKTIAYDYGSQVTTHNHLWDEQTGNVLLTSVTNEFEDDIYNFSYPAHFAYDRMGPAYKNIDYVTDIVTNSSGKATVSFNPFVAGDELYMVNNTNSSDIRKGWVLKTSTDMVQVIDRSGDPITGNYKVKIIRSGRRNLSATPVGSIATMYNPMPTGPDTTLTLDSNIIQSAATTFSDEWQGYCDLISYKKSIVVCDTYDFTSMFYPFLRQSVKDYGLFASGCGCSWDTLEIYYDELFGDPPFGNPLVKWYKHLNYFNWSQYDSDDVLKDYYKQILTDNDVDTNLVNWDSTYLMYGYMSGYRLVIQFENTENHISLKLPICKYFGEHESSTECSDIIADADSLSAKIYAGNPEGAGYEAFDYVYVFKDGDSCKYYMSDIYYNSVCQTIKCNDAYYCEYALGETVNPFINGMRGTWRPKSSYAIVSDRKYTYKGDTTDIRHDGLIKGYIPFWKFDVTGILDTNVHMLQKWVESNQITSFSPEGNELEEKNALGIFSAQLFGYSNTLVTAVAANARHRQIAFENFEDYSFPYIGCRNNGHWDFRKDLVFVNQQVNISGIYDVQMSYSNIDNYPALIGEIESDAFIADSISHTGLHSMAIRPTKTHSVTRLIDFSGLEVEEATDTSLFRIDSYNKCISAFAPDTGYSYVVSGWVHEALTDLNSVNTFANSKIKVELLNGLSVVQSFDFTPEGRIIEGWQRIFGTFKIPGNLDIDNIRVTLLNDGEVISYFDDIRIHPINSSMVSYVYHPVHLKIMAELDDNNFATLYEYDDEGSLIRIKKETEKGILTIQESRKSVKKIQ